MGSLGCARDDSKDARDDNKGALRHEGNRPRCVSMSKSMSMSKSKGNGFTQSVKKGGEGVVYTGKMLSL